jgi:hypothetical protein
MKERQSELEEEIGLKESVIKRLNEQKMEDFS